MTAHRTFTHALVRFLVAVAIACIVIGSFFCILAIWEAVGGDMLWRCLATLGVVFLGCTLSSITLMIAHSTRPAT